MEVRRDTPRLGDPRNSLLVVEKEFAGVGYSSLSVMVFRVLDQRSRNETVIVTFADSGMPFRELGVYS